MASSRRGLPEINAGSMADIAFLLLIFFLVTTTMDVDSGIPRKLPPMENQQETPPKFHKRNIYKVWISGYNKIMVNEEVMPIEQLRRKTKMFINNNGRNKNLSENPEKAIISLKSDKRTSYETYIRVQNELTAAYTELRNEAALDKFDERFYANLGGSKKKEIKEMYPQKISEAEPVEIKKED